MKKPKKKPINRFWNIDEETIFLNHGSFGSTPKIVLEEQNRWKMIVEKDPVRFYDEIAPKALLDARIAIANFVKCDSEDLALIENATSGVNTVLRSLDFNKNDEILIPNHAYQACRNAVDYVSKKTGAKVITCDIPFPVDNEEIIIERVMNCVSERTKLALIDTVTSPTGIKMPFEKLVNFRN